MRTILKSPEKVSPPPLLARIPFKFKVLPLLIALPMLAIGCQEGPEEVVNVYSHRHYDADQFLFDRFSELTGIEVRVVTASADELITRLEREGEVSPADVLITVDAGRLHRAKELELLRPVRSPVLSEAIPDHLRDPEGYWFGLTQRARILAYARDHVTPMELSTYEDLADPRWRGRHREHSPRRSTNRQRWPPTESQPGFSPNSTRWSIRP